MSGEIGLRELISQVKKELYTSIENDPHPFFYLESMDLELAITYRVEGSGGLKIYVIEAGAASGREKTNTIQVHLRPLLSREGLQLLIENNPELKQRIQDNALKMQIKSIFPEQE